jgi:glycosyltransferase involved in cell wall biosynthesis
MSSHARGRWRRWLTGPGHSGHAGGSEIDSRELPRISIITSIYKGGRFIRPFLEDITRQSLFGEKCELLLLDAASPENEAEVIREYLEIYPKNIVYRRLESDPGLYAVWNLGVEMASGEYLTNANLDDRKAPWSLKRHAQELFRHPEIDLVYADMAQTHRANETWESNSSQGKLYQDKVAPFSLENLKRRNMPHANPMWRKSLHDRYGLFDPRYRSAGDWEMWLRAASRGSRFQKIEEVLGLYYFNPAGISTDPGNDDWKKQEERSIREKYANV